MRPFEDVMRAELAGLLHAGVPPRGVRLTVRELLVTRFEQGPLGAREIEDAVGDAVRAACRLVREMGAPAEIVELVCGSALDAVRGHGGESARWLGEATHVAYGVLDELARKHTEEPTWRWVATRLPRP